MTVLPLALVTESPEQEAVRSPMVKKTRPEVFTTAPPPVQAPPACGNAVGDAAAVGGMLVGDAEVATGVRAAPGTAVTSSGTAVRIRSAVQKPRVCCCPNEAEASAAAEGMAAVSAPAIRAPVLTRTDMALR